VALLLLGSQLTACDKAASSIGSASPTPTNALGAMSASTPYGRANQRFYIRINHSTCSGSNQKTNGGADRRSQVLHCS
jgi:hypothetical protein